MSAGRIALIGALAGAAAGTAWVLQPLLTAPPVPPPAAARAASAERPPGATLAAPAAPAPTAPREAPPAEAPTEPPRFDIARVGARGMLVAAGRAAPGAEVLLLEGGTEIGRARADGRGEWVILPAVALGAGARELSLVARRPGGVAVPGRDVVLLVVPDAAPAAHAEPERVAAVAVQGEPERGAAPARAATDRGEATAPARTAGGAVGEAAQGSGPGTGALAVLLPAAEERQAEAPRLLQVPHAGPGAGRGGRLGLDVVDYEEGGEIRFAGRAPPGATVRLYVGPSHLGDAAADAAGRWQLTPEAQPGLGRHVLRVDQLAGAQVAARVEVPFLRETLPEAPPGAPPKVVVQPGNNLWRIARQVYGRGTRFTVIYAANREQIRDPRLIYPGQVFALPGASAPAASSVSR